MNLQQLKKELYKDPEFIKEYEKYDLAFEVSKMLMEARMIKGITQEKLAEMICTKQSGIARAESGTGLPSLSFLEKIAKVFETNLIIKFGFIEENNVKLNKLSSAPIRTEIADKYIDVPAQVGYSYTSGRRFANA